MIGIWAILITTSLSTSVSKAYVDGINKGPLARLMELYVVSDQKDLTIAEVKKDFLPLSGTYKDITPSRLLFSYNFYINDPKKEFQIYSNEVSFLEFYDQNSANWLGKKDAFETNEIALCYYCFDFGKRLWFNSPEDMLGKNVTLTFDQKFRYEQPFVIQKNDGSTETTQFMTKDIVKEFKVAAVLTDTNATWTEIVYKAYIPYDNYTSLVKEFSIDKDIKNVLYNSFNLILKDFRDENKVKDFAEKIGKYTFSPLGETNRNITQQIFTYLSIVFSSIGLVSLLTATFGIFNAVTTSILERKKEIRIYKSLGSSNVDIFKVFLLESIFLGILGWIFGCILTIGTGEFLEYLLSRAAIQGNNPNPLGLDPSLFNFTIPTWLIFGSFALSIIITVMSSIVPAIRASKQDPADILRAD